MSGQLLGQSIESDLAPAKGQFLAEPLTPPAVPYLLPDGPESVVDRLQVREDWFTLRPGIVLIADYNAFEQDAVNLGQVGPQRDQWDDRAARLMFRGKIGREYKAGYLFAAEYKGFDIDPDQLWQVTDLSLTFPVGGEDTTLTVGKTKETFCYEMVGDAANMPAQERVLSPFFVSRNVGVVLRRVLGADHRMTASTGIYNDWFVNDESFTDSGTDVTGRLTGLLWDHHEHKRFLHVGLAGRYAGGDNDVLRYRGRPESNVADYYVDTGPLASDHALNLGVEMLWNEGPFSVLTEYIRARALSSANGNPEFDGFYVTGSWVLTGETRPYDRTVGYARRVIPEREFGAWELVGRYSNVDLDDELVLGGAFDRTCLGLNWWATRHAKVGVGWGHTWLDRFGVEGESDSLQTRFQVVY